MQGIRYWSQRYANAGRKLLAGLGLRGESVWPGVHNDLFVAHASVYHFFARFAEGARVLDAGCGTGYGSHFLAQAGAQSIQAVDIDVRSIRYARRHFGHSAIRFDCADLQTFKAEANSFDLVVSSNVLEHLPQPEVFLRRAAAALAPSGKLALVMPPIANPTLAAENAAIDFHVSNLTIDEWIALFKELGFGIELFRHDYEPGIAELDFRSPFHSPARVEDFVFEPCDRDTLYRQQTLSGIYLLTPQQ